MRWVRPFVLLLILTGLGYYYRHSLPALGFSGVPSDKPVRVATKKPDPPETCDGIPLPCIPDPPRHPGPETGWTPNDDGPDGVIRVKENASLLYSRQRFADLDALIDRYGTLKYRFDDGRFKLAAISAFFDQIFSSTPTNGGELPSELQRWVTASPNSPATALATAAAWRNAAWRARGNGLAKTVTPEGWRLFRERLLRDIDVLKASESYASLNPLWYIEYMQVNLRLDVPLDQQLALYRRGIRAFSEYFPLHFQMMVALLPQWHGSHRAQTAFIEKVVANTSAERQPETYTRLWWFANQMNEVDIFRNMGASWPRMKEGFESLVRQFPDSRWNRSNYAMFACDAGDMTTYTKLRAQLGEHIYPSAFPSNLSIDVCDARAGAATT